MALVCVATNDAYAALGVVKTGYRTQQEIVGGRLFVDEETTVVYSKPDYGPDSANYGEAVVFLEGTAAIRSYNQNGVLIRVIRGESSVVFRVRGLTTISEGWGRGYDVKIRPLEGMVAVVDSTYQNREIAYAANKTYFQVNRSGQISQYSYHWWDDSYSDFEKWCLAGGYGSYSGHQYDDRAVEYRGHDDYGRYIVVRAYDPEIHVYYGITYYYTSDPWWWYRADYGRFQYAYGCGWVFVPYPIFWHRHYYYHEAPPNGHYYHGIIIKEKEGQAAPQIPKERVVPYHPIIETPEYNDPSKYKKIIRRIDSPADESKGNDGPASGSGGGNQVVPREPQSPRQSGTDEPRHREPEGYVPREPQKDNPSQINEPQRKEPDRREPQSPPPNSNGQVKPKEPQDDGNQSKPPEKTPDQEKKPVKKVPEKNPDPPKKEKT